MRISNEEFLADLSAIRAPNYRREQYTRFVDRHPGVTKEVRQSCYNLYWSALSNGILVRPDHCECCGGQTNGLGLDGHHDDYHKPLEVKWLCRACHRNHHLEHDPLGAYVG